MRRRTLVLLALVNLALAAALASPPAETQIIPLGLFDCCRAEPTWEMFALGDEEQEEYCCPGCCWLRHDCETSDDCKNSGNN